MLPLFPEMLEDSALSRVSMEACEAALYGGGLYLVAWYFVFRHPFSGSYFSTFEHELTHALFAWMTLHRVTGLQVTWSQGGAMTYVGSGGGNWLISIGPYWFPTLCIIPALMIPFVSPEHSEWVHGLLGFTALYHITSTWRETHAQQTDLQETGWLFAIMFIPTANLISYAWLLIFSAEGASTAWRFVFDWLSRSYAWVLSF